MFQWNNVYSVVVIKYFVQIFAYEHDKTGLSLNPDFTQNSLKWLKWWWKGLGKNINIALLVQKVTLLESNSENTKDHRAIINLWYFFILFGDIFS